MHKHTTAGLLKSVLCCFLRIYGALQAKDVHAVTLL